MYVIWYENKTFHSVFAQSCRIVAVCFVCHTLQLMLTDNCSYVFRPVGCVFRSVSLCTKYLKKLLYSQMLVIFWRIWHRLKVSELCIMDHLGLFTIKSWSVNRVSFVFTRWCHYSWQRFEISDHFYVCCCIVNIVLSTRLAVCTLIIGDFHIHGLIY